MKQQLSLAPEQIPLVCIMGPTATGKTDAAAQLYENIDAEIISVDSSLVYEGMNIGTAKPNDDFLSVYPHHLVDIRHPNDTYSVAEFFDDCRSLIQDISQRGKLPILAGGTMFYFAALEQGLSQLPKADEQLRTQISNEANNLGWPALHERLSVLDPKSASRIDEMDAQRIQRALEIVLAEGKPVADYNINRKLPPPNPIIKIGLSFSDRSVLHERISRRFDIMLEQGLEAEVGELLNNGVSQDAPSLRMIGYRQMLEYLRGEIDHKRMREKGVVATRQLAKRQLTWMRNQNNLIWWVDHGLETKQFQALVALVRQYI